LRHADLHNNEHGFLFAGDAQGHLRQTRRIASMNAADHLSSGGRIWRGPVLPTELSILDMRVAQARAKLSRLERDIAKAQALLDGSEAAQLLKANAWLVQAALSAQQLQRVAETARQHQTELLAIVAHELRNPLNPIRTAAALMPRVTPQELPRLQAIIERQVLRVTRLASDLLDVSRAGTGKLRLQFQRMDLVEVLNEAIDTCRPAMDLRLQRLSVQLPASPVEFAGDAARLVQVFTNLLDNASKYTPDGGEIALSGVVTAETAVITVTDTGIGMTPQAKAQVFDPFVQEPRAVSFNGLGLGLGLTVVRELVRSHRGDVIASSAGAGRGSRFVVTLPLVVSLVRQHTDGDSSSRYRPLASGADLMPRDLLASTSLASNTLHPTSERSS
jgi:diguanylate cyclase